MPLVPAQKSFRFVAVDPGEQWCGQATIELSLDAKPLRILADSRVYHIGSRNMIRTVNEVSSCLPATLIVEDYRQRPVGHQRFNKGYTLRMIGALEFAAAMSPKSSYHNVPAGRWEKELPLLFGSFLDTWRDEWMTKNDAQWRHAWSAWRIMGRYLLANHPDLLATMQAQRTCDSMTLIKRWLPLYSQEKEDRVAPCARWNLPSSFAKFVEA